MIRNELTAAALAVLLAVPALAGDRHERYDDRYHDQRHGYRHDDGRDARYWRHLPPSAYRHDGGYRAGYEAGWRDGARQCRYSYRPGRWHRDSRGHWYFGFEYGGW